MTSELILAQPRTAHQIAGAVVAESGAVPAARPCRALVPAGFFPRVPPPPVRVSVMTYWNSRYGDLTYITRHMRQGRAVAAQCGLDWCIAASRQIGLQMSRIIARGVPHRVELRVDRDGFKTLIFIPEVK
jgi:hypothetical protein